MEQTTGFGNNYDHQATLRFFRRWWKTLLIVFVVGAAASLLVAFLIKPPLQVERGDFPHQL